MLVGHLVARRSLIGLLALSAVVASSIAVHPEEVGPRQVGESSVEAFAARLLGRAGESLGGLEVSATLVSGSEVEDPEGRIEVLLEAVVRIEPRWSAGQQLRATLLAYDLEEQPLILEEVATLADSAAAWWIYRRAVLLPEDFLEAVFVVEEVDGASQGGARVAYGPPLAAAVAPPSGAGVSIDQLARSVEAPATPRPAAVLRLVPPPGREHTGAVRIRTILTTDAVSRVVFFLDGQEAASDDREPFAFEAELGSAAAAHEIVAVAYSSGDRELGRDRLLLNASLELFDIRLVLTDGEPGSGELVLEAAVSTPRGAVLDRVELYRNETLLRSLDEEPFRAALPRAGLEARDYLRAVAYLADGTSIDDVRLLSDAASGERIEVNLVQVFVVASDRKGEPVTDLTRDDFSIRLGRRQVAIERFERAVDVPLTLGLVFDTSGSMYALMPDAKQAGARFLGSIVRDRDRAFLVDFDTRPRLAHGLTDDLGSLLRRFGQLESKGRTALYDAVVFGALQFDEQPGRRALVVLTDGVPSGGRFGARDCIKLAEERAIPIYSIDLSGVLSPLSSAKLPLLQLAKSTGGHVHTIPGDPTGLGNYEGVSLALEEAYAQIERELRSQYIMAFSTAQPLTADEIKRLQVDVSRPGIKVRRVVGTSRG